MDINGHLERNRLSFPAIRACQALPIPVPSYRSFFICLLIKVYFFFIVVRIAMSSRQVPISRISFPFQQPLQSQSQKQSQPSHPSQQSQQTAPQQTRRSSGIHTANRSADTVHSQTARTFSSHTIVTNALNTTNLANTTKTINTSSTTNTTNPSKPTASMSARFPARSTPCTPRSRIKPALSLGNHVLHRQKESVNIQDMDFSAIEQKKTDDDVVQMNESVVLHSRNSSSASAVASMSCSAFSVDISNNTSVRKSNPPRLSNSSNLSTRPMIRKSIERMQPQQTQQEQSSEPSQPSTDTIDNVVEETVEPNETQEPNDIVDTTVDPVPVENNENNTIELGQLNINTAGQDQEQDEKEIHVLDDTIFCPDEQELQQTEHDTAVMGDKTCTQCIQAMIRDIPHLEEIVSLKDLDILFRMCSSNVRQLSYTTILSELLPITITWFIQKVKSKYQKEKERDTYPTTIATLSLKFIRVFVNRTFGDDLIPALIRYQVTYELSNVIQCHLKTGFYKQKDYIPSHISITELTSCGCCSCCW